MPELWAVDRLATSRRLTTATASPSLRRNRLYYGLGTFIVGGWILQNPSFYGWGALQAYLPEKDLAIAASATLDKETKVGLNGGQMVFEEIAAVLAPGHPPKP